MPRPQRCRRICSQPTITDFLPDTKNQVKSVIMTLDEYEVIRLVDLEKHTHEQCAKQMEISRSTVTEIYESAREKMADCLVNGYHLTIDGGHYKLCDGNPKWCYKRHCEKQNQNEFENTIPKGDNIMRIAVTYENGMIFQHFGHTQQFKIYDVENNTIVASQLANTLGSGHGALAGFLSANKVDILICGGIGGGAQTALREAGIKLFGGVQGNADDAVKALLGNNLSFNPNVHCSHHEHGEGHICGDLGCGKNSCH